MKRITSWILAFILIVTNIFSPLSTSRAAGDLDYYKSHEKLVQNNELIVSIFGEESSFQEITFEKDGEIFTEEVSVPEDYEDTGRLEARFTVEEPGTYTITKIGSYSVEDSFTVFENVEEAYGGSLEVRMEDGETFEHIYEVMGNVRAYDSLGSFDEFQFVANNGTYTSYYDGFSVIMDTVEELEEYTGELTITFIHGEDSKTRTIFLDPVVEEVEEEQVQLSGEQAKLSSYKDSPVMQKLIEEKVKISRISGKNRYETAVAISQSAFKEANTVVLVNSMTFPDALSAGSFAYQKEAPILFTGKDDLPASTLQEIKRLASKRIVLVGGTGSVSKKVENALQSNGLVVERIPGKSRFETAIEIAKKLREENPVDTVILANGFSYPDALSIAPYSAVKKYPILYTDAKNLESTVKKYILTGGYTKILIVGGEVSVSEKIEKELKSAGLEVQRVKGSDRYDTSSKIAETFFKGSKEVFLASGQDFPDALAGGVFVAKKNSPIILTGKGVLSQGAGPYINNNEIFNVNILGGEGVLSPNLTELIKNVYLNSKSILEQYAVQKEGEEVQKELKEEVVEKPLKPSNPLELTKTWDKYSVKEKAEYKATLPYNNPKKIMIDPGHGAGAKRGFVGSGQYATEGDNNYFMALVLKEELEKLGFEVGMTRGKRTDDPSLWNRGQMAKGYDLFISVHSNAANGRVRGTEVYDDVLSPATSLAKNLSASSAKAFGHPNRGRKTRVLSSGDNWYGVIRNSLAKHSMLCEYGFHDNAQDARLLMNQNHRVKLMTDQARIIHEFFKNK